MISQMVCFIDIDIIVSTKYSGIFIPYLFFMISGVVKCEVTKLSRRRTRLHMYVADWIYYDKQNEALTSGIHTVYQLIHV
jgi:hypothetical protein